MATPGGQHPRANGVPLAPMVVSDDGDEGVPGHEVFDSVNGVVGAAIVNHNHFGRIFPVLQKSYDLVQALWQTGFLVVSRDDNRQERLNGIGLDFSLPPI
jgi:hypothetical protein